MGLLPSDVSLGGNSKDLAGMSNPFILTLLNVMKILSFLFMGQMKSKGICQLSLSCIAEGLMQRVKTDIFATQGRSFPWLCFYYNLSHRKEATV